MTNNNVGMLCLLLFLWCRFTNSMMANPRPRTEIQPDGSTATLVAHGDEIVHFETDLEQNLVVRDKDGTYVYANELSNGDAVPSKVQVGKHSTSKKSKKGGGLRKKSMKSKNKKGKHVSIDCKKKKCGHTTNSFASNSIQEMIETSVPECGEKKCGQGERRAIATTTGTLKNLVVLLHFKDHAEDKKRRKNIPSVKDIDVLMNSDKPDPELCPTGSLKNIYRELSYGNLNIESTVTEWYQTKESEAYYADSRSG